MARRTHDMRGRRAYVPRTTPSNRPAPPRTVVPSRRSPTVPPPIVDKPPTTTVTPDGIETAPGTQQPLPPPSAPGGGTPDSGTPEYSVPPNEGPAIPIDQYWAQPPPLASDEEMEETAPEMDELMEAVEYPDPENENSFEIGVDDPDYNVDMSATYDRSRDSLIAYVRAVGPDGYVKVFQLTLPIGSIRNQIVMALSNRVGWSLKSLAKGAGKIARKVGSKRLLAQVTAIANNPAFKAGLKAAGSIYPPLGITVAAVGKASKLVEAVRKGNPDARAKVVELANAAEAGDDNAAKAFIAVSTLYQASKRGVDVSGWSYNLFKQRVMTFLGRPNFGLLSISPSKR